MKLLFDQNISFRILNSLPENYEGSTTVKQEGLLNALDFDIWKFAKKNELIIVTQDSDFTELSSLYGFPPKIIWIRIGNMKTQIITNILVEYAEEIKRFVDDNSHGCFEIIKRKGD